MIRRAESDAELAGWCEVWSAITPREPVAVDEIRARLEREPWRLYLVAEEDGYVGLGFVGPTNSRDRIGLSVRVLPEWRRRGLGSQLFDRVLEHALQREPEWISSTVSEAEPDAVGWASRRGFAEYGREIELLRRLRGDEAQPQPPAGIEIVELTPDLHDAAYELTVEAWEDMPAGIPLEAPSYDTWLEEDLAGPIAFAAMEGGELVGYAALIARDAPGMLENGLTTTRRTHRRRGIATALKQTQIAWAAAHGYREIFTFTLEGNDGMRAINVALGFEEQPAWIRVRRRP